MTVRSLLDRYFIKQPRLRRWVTRALYGDQDTEVTLFGCRFTINSLVIKVDVEGQEWAVLQGAEGLFAASRVKAVYLDGYEDKPAIEAFLRQHGFTFRDMLTLEPAATCRFGLLALRAGPDSRP